MPDRTYGQFCPVAMAAELLCTRWTMVILRELGAGCTRFNELRRGMPRISPALLSQRLKELEDADVLMRVPVEREPGIFEYRLTAAGAELIPLVYEFGRWGQRWVSSTVSLQKLDAQLLMWDMRRNLRFEPPLSSRKVFQFRYPDAPQKDRCWWLIVTPGEPADLCSVEPGFDVDLYVQSPLAVMTAIWMGHDSVAAARAADRLMLTGDQKLADTMEQWLGRSPFATEERMVA